MLDFENALVEFHDRLRIVEQDQGRQGQDTELRGEALVPVRVRGDEEEVGKEPREAVEIWGSLSRKGTPRGVEHDDGADGGRRPVCDIAVVLVENLH